MPDRAATAWSDQALLVPARAWARLRPPPEDLSWVGPAFHPDAEPARYKRLPPSPDAPGVQRYVGVLARAGTPESVRRAAWRAHLDGRPSAWLGLDLLFLPIELAIETRDAWWRLGSRDDVAHLLLEAFGVQEVAEGADAVAVERLLAWLPDYLPERGCGDQVRRLAGIVGLGADRWHHLPGERHTDDNDPDDDDTLDPLPDDETSQTLSEAPDALSLSDMASLTDALEPVELVSEDELLPFGSSDAPRPNDPDEALACGEVQAVRSLEWYVRRSTGSVGQLRIEQELLLGTGGAPPVRPEDALLRLGTRTNEGATARLLRVLPTWSQLRYLPAEETT
jgi:hypothetical protein